MTKDEKNILGMVVLDPDAWMANAIQVLGPEKANEALAEKIEVYTPLYEKSVADGSYKPVAQIEAEKQSSPEYLEMKAKMESEFAKKREAERIINLNLPSTTTVFERLDLLTKDIEAAKSITELSLIITDLTKKVKELTEVVCILAKVK